MRSLCPRATLAASALCAACSAARARMASPSALKVQQTHSQTRMRSRAATHTRTRPAITRARERRASAFAQAYSSAGGSGASAWSHLQHGRVGAEVGLDHVDAVVKVGAGAVHLVDEAHPRHVVLVRLPPHRLRLRLDTRDAVKDCDGAVEDAQRALDLRRGGAGWGRRGAEGGLMRRWCVRVRQRSPECQTKASEADRRTAARASRGPCERALGAAQCTHSQHTTAPTE